MSTPRKYQPTDNKIHQKKSNNFTNNVNNSPYCLTKFKNNHIISESFNTK